MTLQFGQKQDLILIKKMEQFSKSIISEKNINNYVSAHRKDLTDELKTLNERILSIKDYYKSRDRIDFKEKIDKKTRKVLHNYFD